MSKFFVFTDFYCLAKLFCAKTVSIFATFL